MRGLLGGLKNMTLLDETVKIRSAMQPGQEAELDALAEAIAQSMPVSAPAPADDAAALDPSAFFKLSYGLFVLSSGDGGKDGGCIINTAAQLTDTPKRISITVNKANFTHDLIAKSGVFNLSVLTESVPFALIQQFGFQSGRTADKFAGIDGARRAANGIMYLSDSANALISGKVISSQDLGTHTLFIADATEARVLANEPSVTYDYYFRHIKPKPAPAEQAKKGFRCKICGYFYEGDELPPDFICPWCKHGAEDFERVG
jgi:flavin reductase (DIM6/NTAB) family NADH-FMN oxidoreductase RutF